MESRGSKNIFYLRHFALRALEVGLEPTSKSGCFGGKKWPKEPFLFIVKMESRGSEKKHFYLRRFALRALEITLHANRF